MTANDLMNVRVSLPTVVMLVGVVGGGAFAAGRAMSPDSSALPPAVSSPSKQAAAAQAAPDENEEPLPPGHPPTTGGAVAAGLPAGHPPVDSTDPNGGSMAAADPTATTAASLEWKAPARWQLVPNANTMRLATYRVPRVQGDTQDAELSVTQAGGSVDANAQRWIGQFDAEGQKTAKRSTRKVAGFDVAIVEVQGTYAGGMGKDTSAASGWALLGAIVSTPTPHFFKLTGPAKSVQAAHAEFDSLIASVSAP